MSDHDKSGLSRRSALGMLIGAAGGLPAAQALTQGALAQGLSTPQLAQATPRRGGVMRVAQVGDVGTADGHLNAGFDSFWQAYDRLTSFNDKLEPQPMLAESWDLSSDARQIKLNLRKGVQFHSGREFTSDDVKYNMLRVRDPKIGAGSISRESAWFEIDTPDKYTVVLKSDLPRPSMFDFFEYFNILDRETMEGPNAKSKVVGTGPFTLAEWRPGVHIRLVKNKNYWRPDRPYLDELQVIITPDPQNMVAQLEAGAVDAINRVPARDFVRLQKDSRYHVHLNQNGPCYLITVNTTLPPFDNKKVRQALNYAIDRKRFVRTVLLDTTDARALPWPPQASAYDAAKNAAYGFDLDKAKALLAEAGVSNLSLEMIWVNSYADLRGLAEIYQGDLAKIGVKATIRPLEGNLWRDLQLNQKYNGLNLTFAGPVHLRPNTVAMLRNFAPEGNASGFKSAVYTSDIDRIAAEADDNKRKQLFAELNDFYLDESFVIPISGYPTNIVTSAKVQGVRHSLHEAVDFTEAWLSG